MKKLTIALFLGFCFGIARSETQIIGPYSGLNNADNPAAIAPEKAQDLLNVDLSLGGRSVKKREGYALAFALSNTTSPVHGTYIFYDNSGNDVALFFNDNKLTVSINGGTSSVLTSTAISNGATYQCTDSQGYAYCANSNRTNIIKTNGNSFSTLTGFPSTGTTITVTPDRLVQGGFTDAPNRVDFSAAADFSTWSTGVSGTSAFNFTISAPGSRITLVCYAFNRVMWFKDQSFGFILPGVNASDWVVQTISPNIGTLDNSYVYYQGILYFRGNDGHIWSYDGSNLIKLSRDLNGTISTSQSRISNVWTQTLTSDWNSGSFDSTVFVDTETAPNSIRTTFPDTFSNFRDGTQGSKFVWSLGNGSLTSSTVTINSGQAVYSATSTCAGTCSAEFSTPDPLSKIAGGVTYYFEIDALTGDNSAAYTMYFLLRQDSTPDPTQTPSNQGTYFYASFTSTITGTNAISGPIKFTGLGSNVTVSSNSSLSGSFSLPLNVSLYVDSSKYQFNLNGTSIFKSTYNWSSGSAYPSFWLSKGAGAAQNHIVKIDNFSVVPETFTFVSQIKNAPSLTSWDSFNATTLNSGGTQTFSIRAATNTFTVNSSTPTYATVTDGSIPSISTGSFFQISDYFNVTSTGSNVELDDFSQHWFEGSAADKAYATFFKDAIWWSVTAGTGSTTNNRILRLDLLNQTWLLYDLPVNGFYTRQNSLYFGHSTTGNIYKFGGVDSDNGSAINSYWKSKDFFSADPFTDDDITDLSVFFAEVDNSTMTVTYTLVGSSSTSYNFPTQRTNASFGNFNRSLVQGTTGNTFNVKFGNNAVDQPFEVFAIKYGYKPKTWIPTK